MQFPDKILQRLLTMIFFKKKSNNHSSENRLTKNRIKVKSIVVTLTVIVLFSALFLLGQREETEEEINLEIIELREKIQELQAETKAEKSYFKQFQQEKELIINVKNKEQENLIQEIETRVKKISELKKKFKKIQINIDQLENQNKSINQLLQSKIEKLIVAIENGVPFEREKRKSSLSSLLIDLKTSGISPSESFNRLITFLNSEEALGYDSQVIRTIIPLKGAAKEVNLVRIGMIFFAVEIGNEIYLYRQTLEGYHLDSEPLDLFQAQEIRKAIEIIQGKRPPELINININQKF